MPGKATIRFRALSTVAHSTSDFAEKRESDLKKSLIRSLFCLIRAFYVFFGDVVNQLGVSVVYMIGGVDWCALSMSALLQGNGYLAVYIAGMIVGNLRNVV